MSTSPAQIARAMEADPHFHPICAFRAAVLADIEISEGRTLPASEIMARFSCSANSAYHARRGVRRLEAAHDRDH